MAVLLGLLAPHVYAQIAFRGASSAVAPAGPAITFRAATTGASGAIGFRGAATTGVTSLAPVFRAGAQASAASGILTLTISKPSGTVENDVMVAAIGVSGNTPSITAPPGWVLVRKTDNASANANSLAVYFKIATTVEPATYQWAFSASGGAAGGIQTFSNVDISSPIDVESGQTTASANSHATPGVTTTVANAMLVTAYTYASSRAWNNPPLVPAAPAVTERVDVRSNGDNNVGQSTAMHQGVIAAAGAVSALTASAVVVAGSADVGNTHVLALKPALRVPRPTATAAGDFMIAAIGVQPSTATVTAPAGWAQVNRTDNAGPTSNSLVIFRKFAVADESASYMWRVTGASAVVGGIQSFVGVDRDASIDAQSGQATASSLQHTAPQITTTVANTMLVGHYTYASAGTWLPVSAPPVMTEGYDVASQTAPNAAGQSLEGTRVVQAAIGLTPAFRSDASADADTGVAHLMALRPEKAQVSIAKPSTAVENDVMIAAIGVTPASVTITAPPGWTLIRRTNNPGGATNSLAVYHRVVTSAEPAGYSWSFSTTALAVGGIQAYVGVDPANPIDVEGGQTTASGLPHAAPAITTTTANTMLVGHYTLSSSTTFAPQDPDAGGPLAAMTESFDTLVAPSGATGQTLEGTRILQAAAGLSPVYTSNAAAQADFGNTHMLALRPQPVDQIDIPKPSATLENNVLIAAIGFRPNTLTITPPAGWTLVQRMDNATGSANSLAVYRKVASVSEPGAYQWSFSSGALNAAAGGIQAFSGVDTVNPIDLANGQNTVSGTAHATPSIVTTVANAMLVTAHTFGSSATWAAGLGLTETYDRANLTVPNVDGQSITGTYMSQPIAGASGAKTSTASANADTGNTHILALRPAQAGLALAHYIHADHLNTPRLITNQAGQAVWRFDNTEPFGSNVPDQNPSGLGNFTCNLRLPGQYFDKETGLHYNYQRDAYDAGIGRYTQPEPIGLAGDINLYRYARNNPLTYIDPDGRSPTTAVGGFIGTLVLPGPGTIIGAGIGTAVGVGIGWWAMQSSPSGTSQSRAPSSSSAICPPDRPDCQEHFTRCLGTSMADLPGSVYGSNRCLLCRDACVRGGGSWPDIAMTGGKSVRCDYWNFK